MIFVLYGAGAASAAAGTRAAAGFFGAAAVVAALRPGDEAAVVAWTAAMAGGLIAAGVAPRRVAAPVIGAAAAIAAGSAENAAIVLGLWTVGTAAAVAVRPAGAAGRRWAFGLLVADALVAGAIAYTAVTDGFAAWPARLGTVGTVLLLASALVRVPAIGWPEARPELGLLLVRAQAVVLVETAIQASSRDVLIAALIAGGIVFGAGAFARLPSVRDAAQEAGLVAAALSVTHLGWRPGGWAWGALAGGTLMHQLRLTGGGRDAVSSLIRVMQRSAGVGLPLLPAAGAVLTAVLGRPDYVRIALLVAIGTGLARRVSTGQVEREVQVQALPGWRETVVLASVAAALAAPLMSLPRPPGGGALSWPPLWAAGAAIAAGVAGSALPRLAPSVEVGETTRRSGTRGSVAVMRILDPPGGDRLLFALLGALAAAAAAVLVLGWLRGFL